MFGEGIQSSYCDGYSGWDQLKIKGSMNFEHACDRLERIERLLFSQRFTLKDFMLLWCL